MKRIQTTLVEGVPNLTQRFSAQSLDFLQDSFKEIIFELTKSRALGTQFIAVPTVISGLIDTGAGGGSYIISDGLIRYNNDLYLCDGFTGTLTGGNVLLCTITDVYAVFDPTTFSDGTTHNIHKISTIVISQGTAGTGTFDYSTIFRPQDDDVLHYVGGVNALGTTFLSGWTNVGLAHVPLRFFADKLGNLYIEGQVLSSNPITGTGEVFILPASYRPAYTHKVVIFHENPTANAAQVYIGSDGKVYISETNNAIAIVATTYNVNIRINLY